MTTGATTPNPNPTPEPPKPGTPEYNAAMAAKYDAAQGVKPAEPTPAQADKPAVPAMPEGGFDKFYNKETGAYNWQAHVAELNFKLAQKGGGEPPKPAATDPNASADPNKPADPVNPQIANNPQGLSADDWAAFDTELVKNNGKLTPTTREKIEKVVPKNVVDRFENLLAMEAQVRLRTVAEYVAGEDASPKKANEELNGLLLWAKDNLTAEDINEHNAVLASPNWKTAIDSLKARRLASDKTSGEPRLSTPTAGAQPGAGVGPFASQAEMTAAMTKRNERGQVLYEVDPNYRAQVRARIIASNF